MEQPSSSFHLPPFDDAADTTETDRSCNPRVPAPTPPRRSSRNRLSSTQIMAWSMANWGYQVPDGSIYRAEAVRLYQEDMHERIEALFFDLDAQNARICAALRPAA